MEQTVLGNVYDKYGTRNPIARRLFQRFEQSVESLLEPVNAGSILDAGCGEGHMTERFLAWKRDSVVHGFDLSAHIIRPDLFQHSRAHFSVQSAQSLAFRSRSFDLVTALEVLEHLPDPLAALREFHRVCRKRVLLSVPREPLWRILNMARLSYVRHWGNTPGHLQHWSTRGFVEFVGSCFRVDAVVTPVPWTIVLASRK